MKKFIIGAQCSGKTALVRFLRNTTSLKIVEMDEEILRLNDGKWPHDQVYKENKLVPQVLGMVSAMPEVIFFENHMSIERTRALKEAGFMVVVLIVNREELLRRNEQRMAEEGYEDMRPYLDAELRSVQALIEHKLVDQIVNGEQSIEKTAAIICASA